MSSADAGGHLGWWLPSDLELAKDESEFGFGDCNGYPLFWGFTVLLLAYRLSIVNSEEVGAVCKF